MMHCAEYDRLSSEVAQKLTKLSQLTMQQADLLQRGDLQGCKKLDRKVKLMLGEKERGIGAIGGTMNEVLTKHGISDADAHYYSGRMRDGAVVVTVEDELADQALQDLLYKAGGHNAASRRDRIG